MVYHGLYMVISWSTMFLKHGQPCFDRVHFTGVEPRTFKLKSQHFLSTSRQPTYIICVSNELCIPRCCELIIVPHGSSIPDPLIHKTSPWKPGWRLVVSGKLQELVNHSTSKGNIMMKPRGRSTEIYIYLC